MTDMIERVAKRLWDDSFDRMPDPPWEKTHELQKRFHRMLARSAIEAMREPTPEMTAAAFTMTSTFHGKDAIYRAMIAAALTGNREGETGNG